MTIGVGKENRVKLASQYVPYSRSPQKQRVPGKLVGVIARKPIYPTPNDYNPLVLYWTVNPYRKDFNDVVEQTEKQGRLTGYAADLFHSCFKNW